MVDISRLSVGTVVEVNGKKHVVTEISPYLSGRPPSFLLRNQRGTEFKVYHMDRWWIGITNFQFGTQRVKPVESFVVLPSSGVPRDERDAPLVAAMKELKRLMK